MNARLEGKTLERDDCVVRRVPSIEQRVHRILGTVMRADHLPAVGEVAAYQRERERTVEFDTERRCRVAPRARCERLRVEHQSIHIENHGRGPPDRSRNFQRNRFTRAAMR